MYSINGVSLDNPTLGWYFRPQSVPFASLEASAESVRTPGVDGVTGSESTVGPPILPLTVNVPFAHLETLNALFREAHTLTKNGSPGRAAPIKFKSSAVDTIFRKEALVDVTYYVEIEGVYWRDVDESTSAAVSLAATTVALTGLFPGLSGPVQDAKIRVKGACTGLLVTDTKGSWFSYASALTETQYLRFEAASGRAFVTTTDVWTGGSEVSGSIDFGGPRGVFEITPRIATVDPTQRDGRLTVSTASRTGAQIEVRGKAAYAI